MSNLELKLAPTRPLSTEFDQPQNLFSQQGANYPYLTDDQNSANSSSTIGIDPNKQRSLHITSGHPTNSKSIISPVEYDLKSYSDKPFVEKEKGEAVTLSNWINLIHGVDYYACVTNMVSNLLGAFLMLTNIPQSLKKSIENLVNVITAASYVPYGISGSAQGFSKNNLIQGLGFLGESIVPWFGSLKDIFLIRGLSAGTDQIWEFADRNLAEPHKRNKGYFPDLWTGVKATLAACYKLWCEIIQDPISTLIPIQYNKNTKTWSFNSRGHNGLMSTILDLIAFIGYKITGKEKLFGPLRDLGSWLFDMELAFQNKLSKRTAGILFMGEALLDFVARYLNNNQDMRLFVNMLSHGIGRLAVMLYKSSDSAAKKQFTKDLSESYAIVA